jgi:ferritin-like metal-binding protein YciE
MTPSQQKVAQYLGDAHASERALVRVLQSQIAMTPEGVYRSALETHLVETRDHAARISARLGGLGHGPSALGAAVGLVESVVGQALALGKTPVDLLRGSGGEEKVLKNAKDACATEALEIATYTTLGRLARSVGDERTAVLADSILADEVAMLERIMLALPALTDAVVAADVRGRGSYDVRSAGAVEAVRQAGDATLAKARETSRAPRRTARDAPTASTPEPDEPWPGYAGLTAAEIKAVLAEGDAERGARVRAYEREHKNRSSVLRAAGRQHSQV